MTKYRECSWFAVFKLNFVRFNFLEKQKEWTHVLDHQGKDLFGFLIYKDICPLAIESNWNKCVWSLNMIFFYYEFYVGFHIFVWDLLKSIFSGDLDIWYICRHLYKCHVVKLNWPNLGVGNVLFWAEKSPHIEKNCLFQQKQMWKHFPEKCWQDNVCDPSDKN